MMIVRIVLVWCAGGRSIDSRSSLLERLLSNHKRGQNILVLVVDQILYIQYVLYVWCGIGRHIIVGIFFFNCMYVAVGEEGRGEAR